MLRGQEFRSEDSRLLQVLVYNLCNGFRREGIDLVGCVFRVISPDDAERNEVQELTLLVVYRPVVDQSPKESNPVMFGPSALGSRTAMSICVRFTPATCRSFDPKIFWMYACHCIGFLR